MSEQVKSAPKSKEGDDQEFSHLVGPIAVSALMFHVFY